MQNVLKVQASIFANPCFLCYLDGSRNLNRLLALTVFAFNSRLLCRSISTGCCK